MGIYRKDTSPQGKNNIVNVEKFNTFNIYAIVHSAQLLCCMIIGLLKITIFNYIDVYKHPPPQ